jgi:N4-gp56 family major capsid protein
MTYPPSNRLTSNRLMTEDQLTRDMLAATATFYNCTGGTNGDLPTNLALSDVDQVTSALLTNDAWMILDTIGGENKFGTGPVRDSYLALGHTALSRDLNNINGFISKWNYPKFNWDIKIFTNKQEHPTSN